MRLSTADLRDVFAALRTQDGEHTVPDEVMSHWLVLAGTSPGPICVYMNRVQDGTEWILLGVVGRELILVRGTSSHDDWTYEMAQHLDQSGEAESWMVSVDDVRLKLLSVRNVSSDSTEFDLRSTWEVALPDAGQKVQLPPSGRYRNSGEVEMVEKFVGSFVRLS